MEINLKILKNHAIFTKNFTNATLVKLAFAMEEVLISPN